MCDANYDHQNQCKQANARDTAAHTAFGFIHFHVHLGLCWALMATVV
jgi:hypothetical protein